MTDETVYKTVQFELTEDHITLLQEMNVRWDTSLFGGPGIDTKRPFGNSGSTVIKREICDMLGYESVATDEHGHDVYDHADVEEAMKVYTDLGKALQIVLHCQTFEPGVFETPKYHRDWERVE